MTQKQMNETARGDMVDESKRPDSSGDLLRRNNRGCKSSEFYNWPEQSFDEMDSPLAVQEYIQQLIRRNPADIEEILRCPEGQELGAWKVEHLRIFCMQLNRLATKLQECCQPEICNQMTASEQWIFLCAAHKQPNECPAIDYTRHTLDGAASLLNSSKYFPSRVTVRESTLAKLASVCRRLYRIFSHTYYHHYKVFDLFERETHLCKRFSAFVTKYELMSKDNLIVPSDGSKPEAPMVAQADPSENSSQVESASKPDADVTTEVIADKDNASSQDLAKSKQQQKAEEAQQQKQNETAQSKIETKKSNDTEKSTTVKATNAADWSSTNTMVKGASAAARANLNETVLTNPSGVNDGTAAPANTTARNTNVITTTPKSGVESEA